MTQHISSSPWKRNKTHTPGSTINGAGKLKVRYFYFQRRSGVLTIVLAVFFVLLLLALTFGWHFDEPRRSSVRLLNHVLLAMAAIPIWYKLPITIPLISECIAVGITQIILSTDKHPDFVISSNSVFGFSYMKYLQFQWSQIERIEVTRFQRRSAFFGDKPVALHVAFHSNVPKVDLVIGKLLGKHHIIRVNNGISETDKLAILELAREYAPHIPIVETVQFINSLF